MSRSVLAPLAVALSALLLAPVVSADPSSPLFVVEQQRSALVSRLARQWSDAFAAIQGLDAKLQERESAQRADTKAAQDEIDALRREVAELRRALHALAARLSPDAMAEAAR
jgi:hypothetical protein